MIIVPLDSHGGSARRVRPPVAAGMFYPAQPQACAAAAASLVGQPLPNAGVRDPVGAIVPHAGWICSGAIAGGTIAAIARALERPPEVIVVFGAVHTPLPLENAALASHEWWLTPGGVTAVDPMLPRRLIEAAGNAFAVNDRFHEREHAVEVELPLLRAAWPESKVLPVEVPLFDEAAAVGRAVASVVARDGRRALYLASSDLTHYGRAYGFAPAGEGIAALDWAKENDRRLLDAVIALSVDSIVPLVRAHANACGGGAIAAMLAACVEAGANQAAVLAHASSYETLREVAPQPPTNAVGYAGVLIGR